jgi:hypothetical protein
MTTAPDDKRETKSEADTEGPPPATPEPPRVQRPDPTRRIIESEDPPDTSS